MSFSRSFFCDLDRDLDLDLDVDSDALWSPLSEELSELLVFLRPSPSRDRFAFDILSCVDGFTFPGLFGLLAYF
jgi:hypothetical protein